MAMSIKLDKSNEIKLRQAQRMLSEILPSVDKLEACGSNCGELRDEIMSQQSKIEALLKHFGNGPE